MAETPETEGNSTTVGKPITAGMTVTAGTPVAVEMLEIVGASATHKFFQKFRKNL